MAVTVEARKDQGLPVTGVIALLLVIGLSAIALPYGAVRALHTRRLAAADRALTTLAASVASATSRAAAPAGVRVLAGSGAQPLRRDDAWEAAIAFPLVRLGRDPGPDPWGNAYFVALPGGSAGWAISAGPNGILETPLNTPSPAAVGDDRIAVLPR